MTFALLRLLSWPYFKRHIFGQTLVVAGIALAVGMYVSMHQANDAIKEAFWNAAEALAGSAHLQVSGTEAGVPETVLERTRQVSCVAAAAAVIQRTVRTGLPGESGLAVLGVDLLEESRFREYKLLGRSGSGPDDAPVFFAQPDSVLVTGEFAARHKLVSGSALAVWTGREEKVLRVRGLLESAGPVRAYHGNVAVMDLYSAQHIFGRRGFFDRIDAAVRPGSNIEECRETLAGALGPHLKVQRPASRGRGVESLSTTYMFLVESSGLLGILVSMALVRHAGATAVARREREIGIVLGLGGEAKGIRRMVLVESVILGVLGGGIGIAIGALGATHLSAALARLLELAVGIRVAVGATPIEWGWAAGTAAAAAVCCALAGIGPARSAASTPPIQLMEARRYGPVLEPRARNFALVALACGGAALLWQILDRRPSVLYVALPLAALALGLMGRALSGPALRLLRPLFAALWPLEGSLAIDGLARANRKTRGTVMGLGATIAVFLAISGMTAGYADSFRRWARQIANADFLIHSSTNPAARGQMFPGLMLDRLRALPGVAAVTPVRRITAEVEGRTARVIGIDFAVWKKYGSMDIPTSPDGIVISRNLANLSGRRTGDRLRINAPDGRFEMPVRAVIDDFTDENGTVWLDWAVFRARFHDDAVEMFAVRLSPGAPRAEARQAILRAFDPRAPVLMLDGEEFRGYLDRLVDQWRAISYIQVIAAALIALLGVGSLLIVSIMERRRELGLMVALGATPAQLARCVLVEALGVAATGLLLGAPLGMLLEAYLLFTLRHSINGFELPWRIDVPLALALLVAVPLAAQLAAALPLRSLNRMNLVREMEADA
jgi:putative ABC transport system permease protein